MDHDEWAYLVSATLGSTVLLAEDLASYRQHFQSYLGAPATGVREQIERGLRYGARDYLRPRAEMFQAMADFWDAFAVDRGRPGPFADRAAASAVWYRRLAASQSARASIHDTRVGRANRAVRALRLVATGVYRSPIAGGVGARALIGDILELIGPAQGAPIEISPDVAARIHRARAAGSRLEAVAERLSRGERCRHRMVDDGRSRWCAISGSSTSGSWNGRRPPRARLV